MAVVIAGGSASAGLYSYSSVIAGLAFIIWLLLVSAAPQRQKEARHGPGGCDVDRAAKHSGDK